MGKKLIALLVLGLAIFAFSLLPHVNKQKRVLSTQTKESYWFLLHRKSNVEYFYRGTPGSEEESTLLKKFVVKTGIPGERPTPLPQLAGREYWIIHAKEESFDNPETAPYFLTLNIPVSEVAPFGPVPYLECSGQCNWELPGYFGLHGVNGDTSKLLPENIGSSGCIRHSDLDITYLYNLLNPEKEEIRYYIWDI